MNLVLEELRVGIPHHVPLVHVLRGGLVESVHEGSVIALAPDGSTLFAAGDPDIAFYPRSAAKPLQAAAMARLGLGEEVHRSLSWLLSTVRRTDPYVHVFYSLDGQIAEAREAARTQFLRPEIAGGTRLGGVSPLFDKLEADAPDG